MVLACMIRGVIVCRPRVLTPKHKAVELSCFIGRAFGHRSRECGAFRDENDRAKVESRTTVSSNPHYITKRP